MSRAHEFWNTHLTEDATPEETLATLCQIFNSFAFMRHNHLSMQPSKVDSEQFGSATKVQCVAEINDHLLGNPLQKILHGGVAATMLDSIGGIQTMFELYQNGKHLQNGHDFDTIKKKMSRIATVDFRIDYLSVGKGSRFIATAEVVRLGSRHCTCQMKMHNEEGSLIAIGTGNYAY